MRMFAEGTAYPITGKMLQRIMLPFLPKMIHISTDANEVFIITPVPGAEKHTGSDVVSDCALNSPNDRSPKIINADLAAATFAVIGEPFEVGRSIKSAGRVSMITIFSGQTKRLAELQGPTAVFRRRFIRMYGIRPKNVLS